MKSPFPGVDPYLEQHWRDIHARLTVYICDQINEQLPGDLLARIDESVFVDYEVSSRWIYPDVQIVEKPSIPSPTDAPNGEFQVAQPMVISLSEEQITVRHIEIVDKGSGQRVVTAIELLSPTNKCDDAGREAYLRKQTEYIQGSVNLVEIDLIRSGKYILAAPEEKIPLENRTPYMVCIRRVSKPDQAEIIPIPIDQPIPNFRIPLRSVDRDVVLQLQPLLDECYTRGRYQSIDYSRSPRPRLDPPYDAWADRLLCDKGIREEA